MTKPAHFVGPRDWKVIHLVQSDIASVNPGFVNSPMIQQDAFKNKTVKGRRENNEFGRSAIVHILFLKIVTGKGRCQE